MPKIRIFRESHEFVTQPGDPNDRWDRDNTRSVHLVQPFFEVVEREGHPYDLSISFDPDPEKPYFLVYAIYSTGDSFGFDEDREIEFFDLFDNYEAAAGLANALRERTESRDSNDYDFQITYNDVRYHIPWLGYFEELSTLQVLPVHMKLKIEF